MSVVEKYTVFCNSDAPWHGAQKPYVRKNYIAELMVNPTLVDFGWAKEYVRVRYLISSHIDKYIPAMITPRLF